MTDKKFDKFLRYSKNIIDEKPEFKNKLEKVMGRVADIVVKKKYVEPEKGIDKSDRDVEDKFV
ncbi:hypothetical protein [Maridesulfovibrio hydrothermalis]|uniref:Uncharacterized protein n=1 Tax=Maridesulfovibrio hydrothermalis AM13 = DSM 14728 TaxID=1121451 RepID=L0R8W6_9BACT|nr:hypothetical protein [Maridesulfovibrio hydrothermalis]CCO22625.1 conserved protein of unknown function [Maridesulfovibrio hydrothermalis AM13 = DSM 14728]